MIEKPRKSNLKKVSGGPALIDENYLTQPLLKESNHFGQKKTKRNFANDNDLLGSMASMVFDTDPVNN